MTITVLVTTYGRRPYLERCIGSLVAQTRPPDELVVVTREGDEPTEAYVADLLGAGKLAFALRHARVREPGVLPANRAGMPLVTGEVLAFLDDDATARPDWLGRIERWFAENPDLGAVGGRDVQHTKEGVFDEPAAEVGRIRWYGRIIGNHSHRVPGAHPADVLKGCNMAIRRHLVRDFDEGIAGHAHYYEMDQCFAVRRAGYRIVFDGDTIVDHYVEAPRYLASSTIGAEADWFFHTHHNRVYVMMKNLGPLRRAVFLAYTFGSDAVTGVLHWAKGRADGKPGVLKAMFRGKAAGLRRYRARRKERTLTIERGVAA